MSKPATPPESGGPEVPSPHRVTASILESEGLPGGHHRLVLRAPAIAGDAQPGQFLHVWCHPPQEMERPPCAALLRRPYSISRLSGQEGVELLLRVRGTGGRMLAAKQERDELDVIGPLGRGFRVRDGLRTAVVVAGGIGVAPVPFLVQTLVAELAEVQVLVGASSDEALPYRVERLGSRGATIPGLESMGAEVRFVSESVDGLMVSELLERHLGEAGGDEVFACGPRAMLKRVAEIAGRRARAQVCLEERMACGLGACRSCVVPARDGYRTVCREGPVFDASEIDWERLET
jgi:dihydroorotate dehydrogenase electron transfer subunit